MEETAEALATAAAGQAEAKAAAERAEEETVAERAEEETAAAAEEAVTAEARAAGVVAGRAGETKTERLPPAQVPRCLPHTVGVLGFCKLHRLIFATFDQKTSSRKGPPTNQYGINS